MARSEPGLFGEVIDQLVRAIHAHRIDYVSLQPGPLGSLEDLESAGFRVSHPFGRQAATVVIDLSRDHDDLLGAMRRTTRNNIRRAENQGLRIREGTDSDLSTFYAMLTATARRQHFYAPAKSYYQSLWKHLGPPQHIKLFVAEFNGTALAGLLAIPFGGTVTAEAFGWLGTDTHCRPNELLVWKALKWSQQNGFLTFDLNGIDSLAARALLDGQPLPQALRASPTRFKLGFGGSVVLLPPTVEYASGRVTRLLVRAARPFFNNIGTSQTLRRILFLAGLH